MGRFNAYVGTVGEGLYRPNLKFLQDMLSGMLLRRSVLLSEIGRGLNEPRRLIHTEKRLSNGLMSERFDDEQVRANYLALVTPFLRKRSHRTPTIAVDTTDITKPRARKMPHLAKVLDASSHRMEDINPGYNVVSIEAVGDEGRRLPLHLDLFSTEHPSFLGFQTEIFRAISRVKHHVPKSAIWVFDRGFDSVDMMKSFDNHKLRWVVRLNTGIRKHIWVHGQKTQLGDVVPNVKFRAQFRIRRVQQDKRKLWTVRAGWV